MKYYYNWKKSDEGQRLLNKCVLDPEGLLDGNGKIQGVYIVYAVNESLKISIPLYCGESGFVAGVKPFIAQNIGDRLLQHIKAWIANGYEEYWTGLNQEDFANGWRYRLHVLQVEPDYAKRLALESKFIEELRPVLQDSAGKYQKYHSSYTRNDLCIAPFHMQRRTAFLERLNCVG
ncbi:MAG: hypothetical protein J6K43_05190 [Lachnospiraceae bacterium]|nr:hypothetical protein [Lachnospiraceae bacterium]